MQDSKKERNELRATLRERFPRERGQLLPALHYLQHEFGHLPGWAMEVVGWHLGIPASEVYGAATSYTELRVEKPGDHTLRVCTGPGCLLGGGRDLLTRVGDELRVHRGETTRDGSITLEETACGYMCALAPVVQWDGRWRGRATMEMVMDLLSRNRSQ